MAARRMEPAYKRFYADNFVSLEAQFGLVVDVKLFLPDGFVEFPQQRQLEVCNRVTEAIVDVPRLSVRQQTTLEKRLCGDI